MAVISDVHANLIALRAVLEEIETLDAEGIISAGDVVGYYPFPNETVEVFRRKGIVSIKGNHDRAVERFSTRGMNRLAAEAVRWTCEHITAANVDYLKNLRSRMRLDLDGLQASVFHGSPRDDDEYLFEVDAGPELLEMAGSSLVITGHTHIPFIRKFESGMIFNPGAVGQPRDGDSRASYALLDSKTGNVTIRRVEFDIRAVQAKVQEVGLPPFLGERLEYGF